MVERLEGSVEPDEVVQNGPGAIYIERCAEFFRSPRKINIFAVKFAAPIAE